MESVHAGFLTKAPQMLGHAQNADLFSDFRNSVSSSSKLGFAILRAGTVSLSFFFYFRSVNLSGFYNTSAATAIFLFFLTIDFLKNRAGRGSLCSRLLLRHNCFFEFFFLIG